MIDVGGGAESTPFPNADNPIEIGAFRYDAKRMGGAPTITASVNYPSCLDNEWTDKVYAEFNGERYYLKQTPTSSYDNESVLYRHDLELVSERVILDNVYFFDTVVGDPQGDDKPVSNSTKVVFFGDVREFVTRLNSSLEYSGLDYTVVVDDDIESEEKLMSFEDQFFSNVLQEIYNTYEVPYYFDGKTIHIGWSKDDVVIPTLEYGVDNALLSITKNNANYKIVNRATATGSSDNIPFYYPNNSPKGDIDAVAGREDLGVTIIDYDLFSNNVGIDESLVYVEAPSVVISKVTDKKGKQVASGVLSEEIGVNYLGFTQEYKIHIEASAEVDVRLLLSSSGEFVRYDDENDQVGREARFDTLTRLFVDGKQVGRIDTSEGDEEAVDITLRKGLTIISAYVSYNFEVADHRNEFYGKVSLSYGIDYSETSSWYKEERKVDLSKYGLRVDSTPVDGDTITQKLIKYVKTSQHLMPSIYRETDGDERFYNATNDTYEGIEFNNPYVEGHPKEHIFTVEDIKPTIKETMVNGLRIDMFSEFAYDTNDNDETYEDEEGNVYFEHPYFYGKLRVMDFNLFDHAIEQQPMTISFTSGHAGACNFEIGVTEEYPQKNPVQVDENGNLLRDENGMVLAGVEGTQQFVTDFQERQQDTSKYEVWIALRKEEDTYGILMPQVAHRPKACSAGQNDGDTFVILGINLPQSYIINAEKKLEAEIIKYLQDNNDEKFTFSIGFSRIYFEENNILDQLSENSKIAIMYNGQRYDLYVSSFSYSMSEGDVLPEIRVELDETLKVSQNALQNAISEVKSTLGNAINEISGAVAMQKRSYVSKVEDDNVQGVVNFKKGIKFGEGGKVEVLDNNSAKLTIEYLEVTKKASFTSLEIQEKTHVGGQILVTPAAINCGEVEELGNAYRCYFQTKGADGDEIFNQFAVGDQAICQTYNAWGSKYYWRLVTGVGEDYIDLSKTECDEDSDVPSAGDKIIQLGNQQDENRQNAIVIAAYGDGSPYIIQYKGINKFELSDDNVVTKLSATENIFTGRVHMQMGSTIPDEVLEGLDETIQEAIQGLEFGKYNLIRNSGFTGDFVSESLGGNTVLDENDELFSDPFRHWTETNAFVQDSEVSQSGKECVLTEGSLTQSMEYAMLVGENYVLSFKARGTTITYAVGGVTETVALTEEEDRYIFKFTATSASKVLSFTDATATIYEIQLERGNVVSAWGYSMWDNQSSIAKYQAIQYLESAIKSGSTDVLGGLILSNILMLGNPNSTNNTAGVSGIYNDPSDVAFWGGGSYEQALATVMKYEEDPTYQPTDEELASMAKVVITHGGRAILNDMVLRGYVYALGGKFQGEINIDAKNVNGRVVINDNGFVYYGTDSDNAYPRVALGATCQNASGVFFAPHADASFCVNAALLAVGTDTHDAIVAYGDARVTGDFFALEKVFTPQMCGVRGALTLGTSYDDDDYYDTINIPNSVVRGLRTKTRVISSTGNTELDKFDFSVLVNLTSGSVTLTFPRSPLDGQEYMIETKGADITIIATRTIYNHYNGDPLSGTITNRGVIRFKYYAEIAQWTMAWVDRY